MRKSVILGIVIFVIGIIVLLIYIQKGGTEKMNYAEDILGKDSDVVLDVLEIIQKKCDYGDKIDKLSNAEKVIYLIGDVEGEVNNGGFSQYMYNSSGKYAKEAIEALKIIGANYTASLLEDAIEIYKNGPTNSRVRWSGRPP